MIELGIAAVAGAAIVVVLSALRGVFRKVLPEQAWDALPDLIRSEHVHDAHIQGTILRAGVKCKKMYCTACQKKWTEPC